MDARITGRQTAIAFRKMENWTSWYCSMPLTDENILREVLRPSGAHIYSEDGDTLHSGNGIMMDHTLSGGDRKIRLKNGIVKELKLVPKSTVLLDNSTGEVLMGQEVASREL
jgi:hypothetical protein